MSGCHDTNVKSTGKCDCQCAYCRDLAYTRSSSISIPIWDKLKELEDNQNILSGLNYENRKKISERLDKLEYEIKDKVSLIKYIIEHSCKRICDLESKMKELDKLESKSSERKYYTCPVCNGLKNIVTPDTFRFDILMQDQMPGFSKCGACNGKGRVWDEI